MKIHFLFVVSLLFFLTTSSLPSWCRAEYHYPRLDQSYDLPLQRGLEASLADLSLDTAVDAKKLCIILVDLSVPDSPRVAAVNGNQMMYAASLPKIAILLGAFSKIQNGSLQAGPSIYDTLTRMIRNSSNIAATQMLDLVGVDYLAELLQSAPYRFYDPKKNGGLWVGKAYGKTGAKRRDPLHNISHGATALQVARFYYLLDTGRLVSPAFSREMKQILAEPAIHHKFVKGLETHRPGARIYRKSGTWRNFHSDSALVEEENCRYIAVALAESAHGGEWLSSLIVALDDLIARGTPQAIHLARQLPDSSRQ